VLERRAEPDLPPEPGMLVADPMLSWLGSGHRYALMVRDA
jgi:hypothetical protein